MEDKGLLEWRETVKVLEAQLRERIKNARFSEPVEKNLGSLIDDSFSQVRHYSTEKLAGIFYGCISWKGAEPRANTDWLFAEYCIDDFFGNEGMRDFSERVIILGAYETLPKGIMDNISGGFAVRPKENEHVRDNPGISLWLPYKEQMKKLKDDTLIEHLNFGRKNLGKNIDLFCGRAIWNIYQCQPFKRDPSKLPINYGKITFD